MIFEQLNPRACRTYLIGAEGSNEVTLVDPVLDHVGDYLTLLSKRKLRLTRILDTHTHADHIQGSAALRDQTGCEYLMHDKAKAHCVSAHVKDGDTLDLGGTEARVFHTPGHSPDSITLVFSDRVLTGDVLFLEEGGAGRDDLPGGDPGEHWDSLQRILTLPEHLVVYPAHEYRNRQPSSLAMQREKNPHLRPRTRDEYLRYVENLALGPADWMREVVHANMTCARDPGAAWIPLDVPACEVRGNLGATANDQVVTWIQPYALRSKLDAGETPLLLDVREEAELKGELGRLEGIRHIPIGSLTERLSELRGDRNREIITLCRMGGRAHTAAQILMQAGFPNVLVLEDGMTGWRKLGY